MREFKRYVLFVCGHNSARSRMAEAFLNHLAPDAFIASSAGFEPEKLDENAIEVMNEIGVKIHENTSDSAFELFRTGKQYNFVITVCDDETAEQCPLFPGISRRIHWNVLDPYRNVSTQEEKMEKLREVRDIIKGKVEEFISYWTQYGR